MSAANIDASLQSGRKIGGRRMSRLFAVLGAVSYFAWGALHLLAAANSFRFADSMEADLVQGRLFQGASYVAFFAVVAVIVAVGFNWRNSRTGYWVNLLTVSAADIPFVLFIVLPGHMTGLEAILGPSLWIAGAATSTLARVTAGRN
jgi:hypothetical protein